MDTRILSDGFTAADDLKEFITKRLEKLETFHDNIISSDVYLKLGPPEKIREKIADIKMSIPGATLFASESAKTFEEATDLSVESLRRQLKKAKQKLRE
jgi:putative sigma-54 modulation protein